MSIDDPIYVTYYSRRNTYILVQGRETFYDENRILREWDTAYDARWWCIKNLHKKPIDATRSEKDAKAEWEANYISQVRDYEPREDESI